MSSNTSLTLEGAIAANDIDLDEPNITLDVKTQQELAWKQELADIEDEIMTLKAVLTSKMRRSAELKKNLGITFIKEVSDDINQGFRQVETKVEQVTKPIYQKTTSVIGGLTGNINDKITKMRQSSSLKTIEQKVGYAYKNVKGKIQTLSKSASQQSFNEADESASKKTIPEEENNEETPLA